MRLAPLCALLALGALAPRAADAQCTGTEGSDFFRVDISEINAIPQANIDQLNALGTEFTLEDTQDLITSAFEGDLVEFTGVIMADPLLSGIRSLNGDGVPNSIQYWVRDSDAATTGPAGQTILINDEAGDGYARGLNRGQEVIVCGFVAPFTSGSGAKALQVSPLAGTSGANVISIRPANDPILAPVTVTTDDIHDLVVVGGENRSQIDWDTYSDFVGQYVRFEAIELIQGIPGDRPNMLFSTVGQDTQVNSSDNSVCFGNRRGPEYYPTGNVPECITDGPFVPPPTGIANLQGFLIFSGYDGPFNFAIPENANWTVLPWEASDFEVTTAPPAVTVQGPTTVPGPSDDVTLTITATPGDGTITSVVVNYEYRATGATGQATGTLVSGETYTATIPAGPNGSFVTYSVTVTDSNGASTTTDTQSYRIFSGPVTSIAQIQETFDGGPGGSPLFTGEAAPIDINLTARVQAVIPVGSNFNVILQDDLDLGPFSGIWTFVGSNPDGLAVGQEITVTAATLEERFDELTQLSNMTVTVNGTPGPYPYKVVPTATLATAAAGEQHEGMMIRFENVTITDANADGPDDGSGQNFGEWQFTNGATSDEVRGDDLSENISNTFNIDNFVVGASVTYIQGAWNNSFGSYKVEPVELSDIGAISVSAENDAAVSALSLVVSPNPLRGSAMIAFETPATGAVSLRVYDVTGREVAVLMDREMAAGEGSATLDASSLASGVYVVRLQAGATVATHQISVVR